MSTKSVTGKVKKFKGFTDLFKNAAKVTKPPETEAAKKPFAGFTEAYKNPKPAEYTEYEDEYEDEDGFSFLMPAVPEEVKKVKVEYKHFVPTKYNEWRDERVVAVQEKMQATGAKAEKGPEETDGSEMGDRPDARPPFRGSEEPNGAAAAPKLDDIFNTKLPPFRDLNEYPLKFQLQKVNDRMRRYLTAMDDHDVHHETASHYGHCPSEVAHEVNTMDAHRRHLKEYFGRKVSSCRTKPIDFRREPFHEWYSKFTFKYERKYKNLPDVPHTLYVEDFGSWYDRVSEKVENQFRKVPEHVTRQNIAATHKYFGDGCRAQQNTFDNSDAPLSGTFPSLSHCETCREI